MECKSKHLDQIDRVFVHYSLSLNLKQLLIETQGIVADREQSTVRCTRNMFHVKFMPWLPNPVQNSVQTCLAN